MRFIIDAEFSDPDQTELDPNYLVDVLLWGIEAHNAVVRKEPSLSKEHVIHPEQMTVSGLIDDDAAMVLDDGDTHGQLSGCSIRRFDENDEINDVDVLLRFR